MNRQGVLNQYQLAMRKIGQHPVAHTAMPVVRQTGKPIPQPPAVPGASPGAGAAPSPAAAPWATDPTYLQQVGLSSTNEANTEAGLTGQENNLGLQYGFNFARNPDGSLATGSLAVDPTNPNSLAAQLKLRFDQGQQGSTNSMASSGQLYAGSLQNALDAGTQGYNKNFSGLQQNFQSAMQTLYQRRLAARSAAQSDQLSAENAALARAQGAPVDPGPVNPNGSPVKGATQLRLPSKPVSRTVARQFQARALRGR